MHSSPLAVSPETADLLRFTTVCLSVCVTLWNPIRQMTVFFSMPILTKLSFRLENFLLWTHAKHNEDMLFYTAERYRQLLWHLCAAGHSKYRLFSPVDYPRWYQGSVVDVILNNLSILLFLTPSQREPRRSHLHTRRLEILKSRSWNPISSIWLDVYKHRVLGQHTFRCVHNERKGFISA